MDASVPPAALPSPIGVEQRTQPDRRSTPTSVWGAFPPAGKRKGLRRAGEHRRAYFVDRFSPVMLAFALMLVIASLCDAVLTIWVIEAGGEEINPAMDRLLQHGIPAFLLGKYLLTVAGLPVLLLFKNHYLFGTQFRVGYLMPLLLALYGVLIGYQLFLMQSCAAW